MQDKKVISYGLKSATSNHVERNSSSVFEITVPYELALGMNEVKINLTSGYLRKNTDILIDVNDPVGNPLYYEISPIVNSDNSRSIIIYISEDVLPGKAEIIFYCVLINGETYKCIVERNILVKETSTSDVKFSEPPKVIYSEKLLPVQLMTNTSRLVNKTFSGASVSTIGGIVPKQLVSDALTVEVRELIKAESANTVTNGIGTSSIQEVPNKINYSIFTGKGFAFSSSMVGGTIIVNNIALEAPKDTVNTSLFQNQKYSASILNVINTSSIEVFPPFFKKIDYTNSSGEQKVQSFDRFFNHGNFTASYYETITLAEASVTQSYAVLDILNLNNTSGKIAGIDVSYKPIGNLGSNFKSLGVFDVQANNLLVDKTNVYFDPKLGIVERPIGLFKNGISDFYAYWVATGNQPATLSASTRVSDGVLLTFPPSYTGSSDNVIVRPKDTYLFLAGKNSDFQFDIQVFSEQVFQKSPQIDVYISGSDVIGTSVIDDVEYEPILSSSFGKYIGSFGPKVRSGQLTFTNKKEGYVLPVFVLRYANWHIGNIEIKPLTKEGFNPSQTKIIASTELITGSELTIQLDYLDAKGKKSKFSTIIDKVYFKGSTVPVSISGSGGSPTPVLPNGLVSGSDQLTSSFDSRYERTGRNIISSSNQVKALLPSDLISSSEQVAYNKITGVPANIVSSSLQFSSYLAPFTGSFTGSFKGDGSGLYNLPISSSSIPLGTVSGSNQLTSSYDTRYEIRGSNIVSSSAQIKNLLPTDTVSSSVQIKTLLPAATVTGSDQLTSSYDSRYERKGTNIFSSSAQVVFSSITGVPSTLVSGSNQLTSSYDTRYEIRGNNIVSSSAQVKAFLPASTISGSDQLTSSYDTRYERKGTNIFSSSVQVVFSSITGVPSTLVSGSNQLTSSYDTRYEIRGNNIVSSSVQIKSLLPVASVSGSDQLTSSYDVRYERRGNNIVSSSNQIKDLLPNNTISSSLQFNNPSFPFTGSFTGLFTGSFSGDGSGLYNLPISSSSIPNGTVSGSSQLTSSYDTRYEKQGTNIFSSSVQVVYTSITGIPTNLVSGSSQLTSSYDTRYEIRGNNIVSSSAQIKAFLPNNAVSGSDQLTSSYDTRYEVRGNNIVSSSVQIKSLLPVASVSGSDQLTSSYDTRYERKGTNVFSSSAQVVYSSITGIPTNLITGSDQLTSSYDTRYERRGNNIVSSSVQVKAFLPNNSVSGSDQISSSFDTRYEIRGNNIVSSSAQVKSLLPNTTVTGSDQLTSSYDSRYERKGTNIFSSSAQVSYSSVTGIPTNLVSGSNQLTSSYDTRYEIRGNNIVSSSAQVKAFLPTNTVSSSLQFNTTTTPFTGSFTGSFKGDGSGLVNIPMVSGSVPNGTISSSLQFDSTSLPFTGSFTGSFKGDGSGLTTIPGTGIVPGYFAVLTSNVFSGSQEIQGSGSKIFSVQGSAGELFAVFDGLSGSLFSVKNISGLPIFEVFSDNVVKMGQFGSEPIKISGSQATITGSFRGDGSGLTNLPSASLPSNLISGSNQLTSSYDTRYERKGTNIFSSSAQVSYNDLLNKPIITLPQTDRLLSSDGTVSGSRANDGLQYVSSSKWTKLLLRTNVVQEQGYSSSFWSSKWTFVSQSTFVASPTNRNFSVYVPVAFNNDTNTPISSSTFHNSYAVEVENHIYGVTGSLASPINAYNWNSTTQFRSFYNPANITANPLISGYSAQSSSVYNGMGGYGGAYTGRPDLNSWYSVTGVSYAGDGLFKVDLSLGPSSSFGWTLYIATTATVIKHEIRI